MQMQVCVKGFLQIPLDGWAETSRRVGGMCQAIDDGVSMTVGARRFQRKHLRMAMWWHNPTNLSMDIFGPNTRRESEKRNDVENMVCLPDEATETSQFSATFAHCPEKESSM
jgi:hypothetical protein